MSPSGVTKPDAAPVPVPDEATRHYLRALVGRKREPVDWSAAPPTYKRYPPEGRVVLPWREPSLPGDLLRGLLGVTRVEWAHQDPGARPAVRLKRPAPSGGALYPIEAYLGDAAGLHHYDAAHHALDLVRPGDHRPLLAATPADLVVVLTAVFWRNGFKYGDFAYRLHCQEIGVLAAQAVVLAEELSLVAAVRLRFDDAACQDLLGLDPAREGVLAVLAFTSAGRIAVPAPPGPPPEGPAIVERVPAPGVADRLPHLAALHAAAAATGVADGAEPPAAPLLTPGPGVRLPAPLPLRLADGLARRGSPEAGFLPREIGPDTLAAILAHATAGYPGDLPGCRRGPVTVIPHVLVQRVAGVPTGAYRYDRDTGELVATGGSGRIEGARLLDNTLLALPEAAAIVLPVGDQAAGGAAFGDRWYRLQQAEAGLVVHRAALAAAAGGLAARIHSDGTTRTTDAAVGLSGGSLRALSFLLLGVPRPGPVLNWPSRTDFFLRQRVLAPHG